MNMSYLLGIDIGTSGTKTVLFGQDGGVVASHTREYPLSQPRNGWAEQDPLDWWEAVREGCAAVLGRSGVRPDEICGVGLSGQMHGLVMLGRENEILHPAILWCDQRTGEECRDMERLVGLDRLIEVTANPPLTGFTASKILWIRKHCPQVYERCAHILLPKDYIRFRLTGEYATEVSDASGMQLLDVPGRCWSQEILSKLSIDPALLGKVYESPEITGVISREAAEATGLKAGTPVVGGAGDNAAAAVGTGTVRDGLAFTTIGTSGVVYAHTDRPAIDPKGRVHTFCCAVPGAWHVMGVTQGAGLSLKWFRDEFCAAEVQTAQGMQIDPYQLMDQQAALSPIGANRLYYLPYLMGERTPHLDPNARGVFFGLSAVHERRDLLRAVMEGVTYSLKDCLSVFDEMGLTVGRMAACGGGGSSPFWRQMLADVFHCPIATLRSKEGPALGVALLAGVGAGVYASVEEACDAVIAESGRQQPNDEAAGKYAKLYPLYRQLYPALRESFEALGRLEA